MEGSVAALLGSGQDSANYTRGRSGVRRGSTAQRTRRDGGRECGTTAGFGAGRSAMSLTHDNGGRVRTTEVTRCSDSAVGVARSDSVAAQLQTRASVGRVGAFMARARWQCHPGQPIWAWCVAAWPLKGGPHTSALFLFEKFSKIAFCIRKIDTR
jgi:hypothetical protein